MNNKEKFALIINRFKTDAGLSSEEFGALFGVKKGAVGKWERGENWPSTEILIGIAEYFNVSVDYLVGATPFKHRMSESQTKYIVDAEEALGILTSNYNEIQKATLENMVKMFDLENKDVKKNIGAVQNSSVSAKVKK